MNDSKRIAVLYDENVRFYKNGSTLKIKWIVSLHNHPTNKTKNSTRVIVLRSLSSMSSLVQLVALSLKYFVKCNPALCKDIYTFCDIFGICKLI
jgi:hypothetical protein